MTTHLYFAKSREEADSIQRKIEESTGDSLVSDFCMRRPSISEDFFIEEDTYFIYFPPLPLHSDESITVLRGSNPRDWDYSFSTSYNLIESQFKESC